MSAAMTPMTTSIVAAPMQLAAPVNSVQTMAAPAYAAPATYTAPTVYSAGNTTLAAPAYTMAAPTVTTMAASYAAPMTTMAAPLTARGGSISAPMMQPAPINYGTSTIMAAPTMTQTMVQAPVAQPVTTIMQAPQMVAAPTMVTQAPVAPVPLTQGIPTPDQISAQKIAYAAALDKQLKDGMETIQKENEIEKSMVKFTADKQLALMQMQIEEQRNEQLALLDEQATIRQCELRKAFVERKIQLDNQANGFTMDYQVKAVQTELAQKMYQFQQTYANKEGALAAQYNQEVAKANTGTTYAVAPPAVVAAPAAAAPAAAKKQ